MKSRNALLGLSLLLAMPLAAQEKNYVSEVWVADQGNGKYKNPILYADYSDPDACRVGDDFYMTSSSFNCLPGLQILHSKDLVNWSIIGAAVPYALPPIETPERPEHGNRVWAPAIRHHNGEFYIFWGDPDQGAFMVKAKDPKGPWTEPVLVKPGKGIIDACPFRDEDGKVYMVHAYAGSRAGLKSVITICELNAEATKAITPSRIVFDGHEAHQTCEGPKFYKRNGYYYIFLIHSLRDRWMRTEACFYSDSLEGEFTGGDVLCDDRGYCGQGVAQGGIVDTPDGKWYAMLFQDSGAVGRIPILVPVTWKDHFPVFGQNGHVPEEIEVHSTRPGYIYQPLVGSDDFRNGLLPRWQFNHDPDPRYYHLDALQGTYTITTREVCTELTQAVNTLTQRMSYPSCAAEVTVDASALKEGDVAGLCALQSCYAAVGITKHHGKYEVLMLDKKEDGILDMTEGTVVESHQMDFRLEADFCNMKDEARCYYRVNKGDWLPIGTVHKLYFKLDHFTGCRFGLFCYAAEETGGSACFRDFKYYDVDEIS